MTRSYARRQRFEARLLAAEVVQALALALGGSPTPAERTPSARANAPKVRAGELLKTMGTTID